MSQTIRKQKNSIAELMRFLFCLLVVGYHVQMAFCPGQVCWFADGALAVEFFFILSGLLLGKSLEKISSREQGGILPSSLSLIWRKIRAILPVHLLAIGAMLLTIALLDSGAFVSRLIDGIPSIFFLQLVNICSDSYNSALIVPEWYLSALWMAMLLICPLFLLLRKKTKGLFATLLIMLIICALTVGFGSAIKWHISQNFLFVMRACLELCFGLLAYYLSEWLKTKPLHLGAAEAAAYAIPLALGILPIAPAYHGMLMGVAVVLSTIALAITFSGKGLRATGDAFTKTCASLGRLSLPIYLLHPVVIEAIRLIMNK